MERSVMRRVREASPRRQVALGLFVAFFVVGTVRLVRWWSMRRPSCEVLMDQRNFAVAATVCHDSYALTGDPEERAREAWARIQLGDYDAAKPLCLQLRVGTTSRDAYACLGTIGRFEGEPDASIYMTVATALDAKAGDRKRLFRDLVVVSDVNRLAGNFDAALDAAQCAAGFAKGDQHLEYRSQMLFGDVFLRESERSQEVFKAFEHAREIAQSPCERAYAYQKLALYCLQSVNNDSDALEYAEKAAQESCPAWRLRKAILEIEAWAQLRTRPAVSRELLTQLLATAPDFDDYKLGAYVEANARHYDEADRYLTLAMKNQPADANLGWSVSDLQGELAELMGNEGIAERHYREAMADVARLRILSPHEAGYLVASHREPYEKLIALLFRQQRWTEVLNTVIALDQSDMLRSTASSKKSGDHSIPSSSDKLIDGSGSQAETAVAWTTDDVLRAWGERDLVIAFASPTHELGSWNKEHAYVLRIDHGRLSGRDVGNSNDARTWTEKLRESPSDPTAARGLGAMLIPLDKTSMTLDVLGVGELSTVRLAALQDEDGSLVNQRRPLERVQSLGMRSAESTAAGTPVILGNPDGSLASADAEVDNVARELGPQTIVYRHDAATYDHLLGARNASVLHIAAHVRPDSDGDKRIRVLSLADRTVAPAELLRAQMAPHIAVLASCSSAAMMDDEGWGSLAFALIEAGTSRVIGTDQSINDEVSTKLMTQLYKQPSIQTDTARALAAVLVEAAHSSDPAVRGNWAAFFVLARPPVIHPTK